MYCCAWAPGCSSWNTERKSSSAGSAASADRVPLFHSFSQMGLAGMLEFVGGALLVIGLFTVPVAAVLFLEMIWAYFQAHAPQGGWPVQNQGELALLYATIFAFLAGNGAGPLSVDAWIPARMHRERRQLYDRRAPATA
jgi:putative oxidoreductase